MSDPDSVVRLKITGVPPAKRIGGLLSGRKNIYERCAFCE
jgi:hypothetical protein